MTSPRRTLCVAVALALLILQVGGACGGGSAARRDSSAASTDEDDRPAAEDGDDGDAAAEPEPTDEGRPSKRRLRSAEPAPAADVAAEADAASAAAEAAQQLLEDESIGGVRLGMSETKVIALLGQPTRKGRAATEDATGDVVAVWRWKKKSIAVTFVDARKKPSVRSIELTAGAKLRTKARIGIGSSRREVDAAYGAGRRPAEAGDDAGEASYVIGTVESALALTFEDDKVSALFWGPLAE
jgi:hypothetical protein